MAETVSDHIWERFREWGVDHVFGYPGDGIGGLVAALTTRRFPRCAAVAVALLWSLTTALLVGCGDDTDEGAAAPDRTPTGIEATATPAGTPLPEPTAESTPTPASTVAPTPTPTGPGTQRPTLDDPTTCSNPDAGYSVDHPSAWSTNDGAVVPTCSLFDPEPFEVPEATDERVAAISIFRENVAFSDIPFEQDSERALTVVDGFQAVCVEGTHDGEGLYPAGTRFTSYRIDLAPGVDDGAGTLLADVVDVGDIDYAQAQRTLDLMIRTLVVDIEADTEPAAVGVFEGGATPVTVLASFDDQVCFFTSSGTIEDSDRPCVDPAGVQAERLETPVGTTVGVAPGDVFRVEATLADTTISALSVPVLLGAGAYAWALPVALDRIEELRWFDIDGNELGTTEPGRDEGPEAD